MKLAVENLAIHEAQAEDCVWAGKMMLETLYGFGTYLTGLGSSERGAAVLRDYFRLPANRFSYQYANIAKLGDANAGLLVSFSGKLIDRLIWRTALQMARVYSFPEVIEYIRRTIGLHDEEEVDSDEYYIAHLAVDSAFHRKGIGWALLEFAERQALDSGLEKLSLMAEADNQSAQALYTKFGFRIVKEYEHPHHLPLTGSAGYVRMVKTLSLN